MLHQSYPGRCCLDAAVHARDTALKALCAAAVRFNEVQRAALERLYNQVVGRFMAHGFTLRRQMQLGYMPLKV